MIRIHAPLWLKLLLAALLGLALATDSIAQDPPKEEAEQQEDEKAEAKDDAKEKQKAEDKDEEAEKKEDSPYLAIVGGDVHTVTQGVIPGGTVLCKGDRILKIGQDLSLPEGARVLRAEGMQVYPGLVGVDSRRILSGSGSGLEDSYDPYSLYVDLGLAGGLTTLQTGGAVAKVVRGTLEGIMVRQNPWVQLRYFAGAPAERRRLRESLEKVREYLRDKRAYDRAKAAGEKDLKEPSDKGLNKGHLQLLRGEATARFDANDVQSLLAVTELLTAYPMKAVVFGGREAWIVSDRLGRTGARFVLNIRSKEYADDELNRPSGWSIENAATLHRAGIEFSVLPSNLGFDTGGEAGRDMLTLPMEAAFAIRGGLPQEAALRSITLNSAKILGVEDRVGSIEVGKDADLIVTDRDLFDYRSFVQWTVVNGRVVYDKQKAPYFSHIRPRPEPTPAELLEAVREAASEGEPEVEEEPPDTDPDRPEGGR